MSRKQVAVIMMVAFAVGYIVAKADWKSPNPFNSKADLLGPKQRRNLVDAMKEFDFQYESYRAMSNLPDLYRLSEYLDARLDERRKATFTEGGKIKYGENINNGLIKSYEGLRGACQARIEAVNQLGSNNGVALASLAAKAGAKQDICSRHFLSSLLSYELLLKRTGTTTTEIAEVGPLISKYQQITNVYGEYEED